MKSCRVTAHPSLALIKYWGKSGEGPNLPAVPSLALTLDGLSSITTVSENKTDLIILNGKTVSDDKIHNFLTVFRSESKVDTRFLIETENTFPTSAGLASSSSGFAALASALLHFARARRGEPSPNPTEVSAWARVGSGSASRAVFGGWTQWLTQAPSAEPLHGASFWPEVRVLLFIVDEGAKPIGSREAMNLSRSTSPYYQAWLDSSKLLFEEAKSTLAVKDFEGLGEAVRQSYLRMFSTMFTSRPPVFYWKERSLQLLRLAETLRGDGLKVFETMDAGPQVKYFCLEQDVETILDRVRKEIPGLGWIIASPGDAPLVEFLD